MTEPTFKELLAASSLGTPESKARQAMTNPEQIAEIIALAKTYEKTGTYANPFLMCDECKRQVTWRKNHANVPCGHRGGATSVCPSWSPVDGCRCQEFLQAEPTNPHALKISAEIQRIADQHTSSAVRAVPRAGVSDR